MRSLDTSIKTHLVKQHEADSNSASSKEGLSACSVGTGNGKRPSPHESVLEASNSKSAVELTSSPKKSRPRSLTFTFNKGDQSPAKRQKSGDLNSSGKSSTPSSGSASRPNSSHGSVFGRVDKFAQPDQILDYLAQVRSPQAVELSKIQKLRQILRNETVGWVEDFIARGGMTELANLLYRTIDVEWREDHEDNLLHEILLCLKALSTTSSALKQLSVIQVKLFPTLLRLLFDEERKGPSEYSTRTLVFNLLFAYLANSPPAEVSDHARTLLAYLRDPAPSEEAKPPGFIIDIYHCRPFRVWNKELSNLTKEVFWIFLHHLNIIPHPTCTDPHNSYYARNFPKEHPPVAAAPYIGGVEWDATAYVTAHLDLLNGIIASLPTLEERNALRLELRDSGFEKLMGGSLRTCKEKLYGSVHEALSIWVGAAKEDGWPFKDVREGPPKEEIRASPKKSAKKKDKAPKLDMPKLEFGQDAGRAGDDDGWVL